MSRLSQSIRNMTSNLFGLVVPVALSLVAVPLLLRWLGPDAYGLSNLVMVLIGYFSIMDMGMDIAGVKLLAEYHAVKDNQSISRLMSTKLTMYVSMGLIGTTAVLLAANLLATRFFSIPEANRPDAIVVFRLAAFGVVASMIIMWASVAPQGLQRYDVLNGISVVTSIVSTGAGLAVVYAGHGVVGFVMVRVAATILAAFASIIMVRRLLPAARLRFAIDREMLRKILGISIYGAIIRVAGVLTGSLDRTLIGVWIGTTAVAAYSVPYLVTTQLNQVVLRLMHFVFPMSSEMLKLGKMDELRAIFIKASKFSMIIATIIVLPSIVLADKILALWVGSKMAAISTTPFRLLLIGCYLSSTVALLSHLLVGIGYVKEFTVAFLMRTAVFTGLCFVLIRPFGISGAGLAVLASGFVDIAIGVYCLRAYAKVTVAQFFGAYAMPVALGVVISCGVALSRGYIHTWPALIGVLVGYVSLYVCLGFPVGVFGQTEKKAIAIVYGKVCRVVAPGRA